jgi:hypothetical protein
MGRTHQRRSPGRSASAIAAHRSGPYGRLGPAACLGLTAVIFAVQVLYSRWWMARFRFGPLEWLWRGATYGHSLRFGLRLPMLRPYTTCEKNSDGRR